MTGNGRSMASFRHHVERIWRKWLRRRSNAKLPWTRFSAFLQRDPLPPVRVVHSIYRHSATPWLEEPDAGILHVRICGSPSGAIPGATRQLDESPAVLAWLRAPVASGLGCSRHSTAW